MATNYKILGQAAPADTSNVDLYTVGSGKQAVVSTITITNVNTAAANATIYIRKAGATAASANTLIKAASVGVADFKAITIGVTLEATDVITVASGTGNALSFQAFGSEIS
jgi:hypothetical protein